MKFGTWGTSSMIVIFDYLSTIVPRANAAKNARQFINNTRDALRNVPVVDPCYWLGVHCDVASYCCAECQKLSRGKTCRVSLVPLPVISERLKRIAMDIVGPLPRSSHGNRYVLVVCDYATQYPEAMAMPHSTQRLWLCEAWKLNGWQKS